MNEVLASLIQVEKIFPKCRKPALNKLTAEIGMAMITGLVGPDGAGKTTWMRLLAGLLDPTSGEIRLSLSGAHGGTFHPADPGVREKIGYMPQKFGLYEDLTVTENLALNADLRGVIGEKRRDRLKQLLDFTDLHRFTDRLAGKLSGGMKQKLGLACSLLGEPQLLLLDEPTVGVDPISRRELWKMVNELVQQGLTVVWSTAYLDEAERCQQALLLHEGDLLFSGNPAELTRQLKGRSFLIHASRTNRRGLLSRLRQDELLMDSTIQGDCVRLLLRKEPEPDEKARIGREAGADLAQTAPRFEDAVIDKLGGARVHESGLARALQERPHDEQVVVETRDLVKQFGTFVAVDHVSFSVKRGEIFGLLGPNGAGKSTTFRMLCGLLPPTFGTATLLGIDLRTSPSAARQKLGYMAQKFSLYGNLTVGQNLKFFCGAYGLDKRQTKEAVERMLQVFELQERTDEPAGGLPLGFKQRLALAAAMMHQPDIVFLDEPTSGVDPVTRREFWTHINGIVEKGVTVVITTHFMEEAEYCDRIGLIYRGKMIATGTPDAIRRQAATELMQTPTLEDAFIALIERETPTEARS